MAPPPRNGRKRTRRRQRFVPRWRANFLTGLVIVAPVALTIYLIWTVIEFIDAKIVPWVPAVYNPSSYLGVNVPGFGVLVFLIFTAAVGTFTRNVFGRQLVLLGESWVDRMPLVSSLYAAFKQIIETVLSQSKTSFQKACLVEYPRKGIWAVAFVSTEAKGEVAARVDGDGEPLMSVFLPTTPNPTSGFLLFVPARDVVELDMTVEEAAKLVISAGLVTPPTAEEKAAAARRAAAMARPRTQTGRNGRNGRRTKA
ncbi:DUF502 domain-containing protein [Rhodovulum sp. DZ06]|uniref:DUF502 domain-containing protein n=1 Tax=Rhodovulum sp. DZ06 TaxID=3425126 RepID=UPI003D347978